MGTASKRICHTKNTIHSCDCQKYCVLRCEAVYSGTTLSAFQRKLSSSSGRSSTLNLAAKVSLKN